MTSDFDSKVQRDALQERKSVSKADVTVERLTGDDIKSHHWDAFYEFYRDTCDRKWGEAYLNRSVHFLPFHSAAGLTFDCGALKRILSYDWRIDERTDTPCPCQERHGWLRGRCLELHWIACTVWKELGKETPLRMQAPSL